jgi:pimeloyl-ACP methyl ester carboxylesterase
MRISEIARAALAVMLTAAAPPGQDGWVHRLVARPGGGIEALSRGHGKLIVAIPSLGRGGDDFADLGNRLAAAGYRLEAVNPRGVGASHVRADNVTLNDLADDVAAVIDSESGRPAAIIGHAFGNRVARLLAVRRPDLAPAIILLAAGGTVPPSPATTASLQRSFDTTLPPEQHLEAVRRAFFASGNSPVPWNGGWYSAVAAMQGSAGKTVPAARWWAGGTARILVVQGREDAVAPPANGELLKKAYPGRVTLVELNGAGHALLPEQPDAVAAAILKFLAG